MALTPYAVAFAALLGYVNAMTSDVIASADRVSLSERLQAAKLPTAAERRAIRIGAGATLRDIAHEVQKVSGIPVSIPAVQRWESGAERIRREHKLAYRRVLDDLRVMA